MPMKQTLTVVAGVVLLVLAVGILIGAYLYLQPETGNEPERPSGVNPFGSLASDPVASGSIAITLTDGSTAVIPDFSTTEQPEAASATNGYQVAGASDSTFQIVYFPEDSGFIVTLNAEPLGEARRAAEDALRARLGLSDTELCKLRADVGTTYSVNATYAGKNLGLSFCPGAVTLP